MAKRRGIQIDEINSHDSETEYDPDEPIDLKEWLQSPDNPDHHFRTFDSGATRDTDEGKPEFAGFLSWEVIGRFGEYMHEHRHQKDGTLRASDNWKKGIPRDVYIQSLFRHFIDLWAMHENLDDDSSDYEAENDLEDALCAILFNAQGYLYERLNGR